jgi:hypothetical protein
MATQGCISTAPPQDVSPSTEFVLKNLKSREFQSSKPASGCHTNRIPEDRRELAYQVASLAETCKEIDRVSTSLTKTILKLFESKKHRDDEEDHSRDLKKGKRHF